jgi:hypothetical protein
MAGAAGAQCVCASERSLGLARFGIVAWYMDVYNIIIIVFSGVRR